MTTATTTTPKTEAATIDSKAPSIAQVERSQPKRVKSQAKAKNATKSKPEALKAKSGKKATKPPMKVDGRTNPAEFDRELWVIGTDKAPPKKVADTVYRQSITHQSGKGTRGERGSHLCPSGNWVSKCEMVRWAGAAGLSREQAAKLLEKCFLPMTAAVLAKYHGIGANGDKPTVKAILDAIDPEDAKHLRGLIK